MHFAKIPLNHAIHLMEKVVVMSLLATYDIVYLPDHLLEYLPKLNDSKLPHKLTLVSDHSLIEETLYWLGQTFQNIVTRFGVDDKEVERQQAEWCLQMLALVLINGQNFEYEVFR